MKEIKLTSKISNDKYTEYVYNTFDIQNREKTEVSIPMDLDGLDSFDWNIGVILGGSGSGKTTILKNLGKVRTPKFNQDKALISNFDWLEPKDVSMLLTSMGLSSVPTWLRPFRLLSNGEQYRAALAYLVASAKDGETILVDEYTSVVDRDVAKAMSFALQKYIRRIGKRIIVASCHYDILEWLMPDWICSPQKGGALERCDYLRRGRPQIELQISRVEYETWNLFKKHHYLTENANPSCKYFLFEWNNKPVGIVAVATNPSGTVHNSWRMARTVVLPDYQGLGIGSKISDFVASIHPGRIFSKTVNPALGEHKNKSKDWKPTAKHGKKIDQQYKRDSVNILLKRGHVHIWNNKPRPSYCHEYIGQKITGYEELVLPINDMRIQKKLKKLNLFFE